MNEYTYELYAKIFRDSETRFIDTYVVKAEDAEKALEMAKDKSKKNWNYSHIKNLKKV